MAHGLQSERVRGGNVLEYLKTKIQSENNVDVVRVVVPKTA